MICLRKKENKAKEDEQQNNSIILQIEIPQTYSEKIEDIKKELNTITKLYEGVKIK